MPYISKFVLGRYWRTATEAERTEFSQLFEDFIVRSYAVRFRDYSGESFKVLGDAREQDGVWVVRSRIERGSSEPIRIDWRLRRRADSYAIIDIIVEGVSMVVTQRSEFASVIQSRGGVPGLLDALREKVSEKPQNAEQ
jgi:phospholipid transport system substrate-binding protein